MRAQSSGRKVLLRFLVKYADRVKEPRVNINGNFYQIIGQKRPKEPWRCVVLLQDNAPPYVANGVKENIQQRIWES